MGYELRSKLAGVASRARRRQKDCKGVAQINTTLTSVGGCFCFLNLDWTECYKACFRASVLRQCYMKKSDTMFFFFNQ
jgi:hypothetical protein